jgi:hypothetical protein
MIIYRFFGMICDVITGGCIYSMVAPELQTNIV